MAKKSRRSAKKRAAASDAPQGRFRLIASNRRARFDFEVIETMEAGLVLSGTEIKSIRAGRVNLRDAYAMPQARELWLQNMHVSPWSAGGPWNHEPTRPRKLLLHREQANHLAQQVSQKGLTLVPLRLYIKDHYAKVELAVAKGRRRYDKRRRIIERETEREVARQLRRSA